MEFSKILLDKISYNLKEKNETISIAESVTSGFLQLAFSQMSEAIKFFKGGITAYTFDEKVKHLNIDFDEAKATNCVSRNISEMMALNVALLFDSDWSVATTGYATPVEESDNKIFAYYCIAYRGTIIRSDKIELHPLTKAFDAQKYFMEYILGCLRCEVKRDHSKLINI
ncbi:CinA family protein [Epilithonimonas sp.]|uniref:CinA family protein n=1 Tax=Epilithonimonas sp. TaxID=2894511 RepID=UPI002FDCF31D